MGTAPRCGWSEPGGTIRSGEHVPRPLEEEHAADARPLVFEPRVSPPAVSGSP
jgi:hypothetical protein